MIRYHSSLTFTDQLVLCLLCWMRKLCTNGCNTPYNTAPVKPPANVIAAYGTCRNIKINILYKREGGRLMVNSVIDSSNNYYTRCNKRFYNQFEKNNYIPALETPLPSCITTIPGHCKQKRPNRGRTCHNVM